MLLNAETIQPGKGKGRQRMCVLTPDSPSGTRTGFITARVGTATARGSASVRASAPRSAFFTEGKQQCR